MTFQRYPSLMETLIFDANETIALGTFDPPNNASLEALELFCYKQGDLSPAQLYLTLSDGSKSYDTETITLNDIKIDNGANFLGKIRVNFPIAPNTNTGTTYTLSITLTDYTPILTGDLQNQTYFSVIRDWPTQMTYNAVFNDGSQAPIAVHLFEGV